jgi:hypothetical protein
MGGKICMLLQTIRYWWLIAIEAASSWHQRFCEARFVYYCYQRAIRYWWLVAILSFVFAIYLEDVV